MEANKDNSPYELFHQVIGLHHYKCHKMLENQGVYPGQPPLLFALHQQDGQSQKQLSKALGIQPATVTMMVKRMSKAGLVERKQDQKDQRVSRVYLTDEGRIIRKRAAIIIKQIEKDCFSNLSHEETEKLGELLLKIKKSLLENSNYKNDILRRK